MHYIIIVDYLKFYIKHYTSFYKSINNYEYIIHIIHLWVHYYIIIVDYLTFNCKHYISFYKSINNFKYIIHKYKNVCNNMHSLCIMYNILYVENWIECHWIKFPCRNEGMKYIEYFKFV